MSTISPLKRRKSQRGNFLEKSLNGMLNRFNERWRLSLTMYMWWCHDEVIAHAITIDPLQDKPNINNYL